MELVSGYEDVRAMREHTSTKGVQLAQWYVLT